MRTRSIASLLAGLCVVTFLQPAAAQRGAPNGEWKTYGGDLGNTRYSPLDQINATNFSKLEVAWRFKTDSLGPTREYIFESTPLMTDGVVYSTAGSRRAVVALDAATGELLWIHREEEGDRGKAAPRQLSGRGLAYWKSGNDARILYVTPGYQLVALDARTGLRIPTFGNGGIVDLKQNDDQDMDLVTGEVGLHATPVVAKDVVIVGAAHRTGANPKTINNVKGYVRGFNVRTGERLWIFHTIPKPGEFGHESWLKGSAENTGNTGVWAQISVDEELETVYLPVEQPTGDYFGANRPGDGLFGETLLAVDLYTGKRKWHYQLVHHGLWDNDIPCAPILIDVKVDGKVVKAVAQPTKQAFLYVFDRVTGKPVWPIVERPVPKGNVPGEWYSPTQPMPTRPQAYDRQGVTENDLIDFTPALRKEALEIVKWHPSSATSTVRSARSWRRARTAARTGRVARSTPRPTFFTCRPDRPSSAKGSCRRTPASPRWRMSKATPSRARARAAVQARPPAARAANSRARRPRPRSRPIRRGARRGRRSTCRACRS
jgi:quinoprotein glucose dehydrogenase